MIEKSLDKNTESVAGKGNDDRKYRKRKLRAISSFAGGIANDFNEILAAIMGYIELTRLDTPVNSPPRKNIDSAMNAIDRAKDLVVDILSYSRQHEFERVPIQISQAVEKCLKSFKSSLPDKIKIRENIECFESRVNADPSQIRQILINLCTNAGRAMLDKGGVIDIKLENMMIDDQRKGARVDLLPGKYVMLAVSDTGCGMDEETIEKIFDPYFTTSGDGPGSGMGLAFVDNIVELCNGYIDVESEPGKGTTFSVILPEV
ncbi:MAG: hypothetical protein JRF40_04375 [Deltaproteobacteria bacterium]|nr:hypothetical protein [Deltaproteobacteria bacterium]